MKSCEKVFNFSEFSTFSKDGYQIFSGQIKLYNDIKWKSFLSLTDTGSPLALVGEHWVLIFVTAIYSLLCNLFFPYYILRLPLRLDVSFSNLLPHVTFCKTHDRQRVRKTYLWSLRILGSKPGFASSEDSRRQKGSINIRRRSSLRNNRYDWHTKKMSIFNVYNLMNLEISLHSWNYHHNLCHKHIHYLQSFLPPSLL